MAGWTWKMAVLVAVMAIFAILEYHVAEAQVNDPCTQCATNAFCYRTYSGNYCVCRRGYYGDGYIGTGYSGCKRNKLRTWQVVVSIIGSVIGALLILCLCLACIRNCIARRRARGPTMAQQGGEPVYGYPQQAPYPQSQQGVPMSVYENNNQKVPGPAGVV
jgi:hypothetical protein